MRKIHKTTLEVCPSTVLEAAAATELKLKVKVACESGCNLQGNVIRILLAGYSAREIPLTSFDSGMNETAEFSLAVPISVGIHDCRVLFPEPADERIFHVENSASVTLNVTPHKSSLAVWDLTCPVVVNSATKMKVGAKCSAGCVMRDCEIEILDDTGITITTARLRSTPWPETLALYWTEADLPSPSKEGAYSWYVRLKSGNLNVAHESASFPFNLIVVRAPEHTVTLSILEKETKAPVADVQVRLGPHRAATAETGWAKLEVPKGSYELNVWKAGYEVRSTCVDVFEDMTIALEIVPAPEPETPYWMG